MLRLVPLQARLGRLLRRGRENPDRKTAALCRELTGREVPVEAATETRAGDIRLYLSDCARLFDHTAWRPTRDARAVLEDTLTWITENERAVASALS